jgi:hypothetical protein
VDRSTVPGNLIAGLQLLTTFFPPPPAVAAGAPIHPQANPFSHASKKKRSNKITMPEDKAMEKRNPTESVREFLAMYV